MEVLGLDTYYTNLVKKGICLSPISESHASAVECFPITNLKKLITGISTELDAVTKQIDVVCVLLDKQRNLQVRMRDLSSDLESLYEKKIQRIVDDPIQESLLLKRKR